MSKKSAGMLLDIVPQLLAQGLLSLREKAAPRGPVSGKDTCQPASSAELKSYPVDVVPAFNYTELFGSAILIPEAAKSIQPIGKPLVSPEFELKAVPVVKPDRHKPTRKRLIGEEE